MGRLDGDGPARFISGTAPGRRFIRKREMIC